MNHFFDVGAHDGNTFQHLGSEYDGWNVWCFEPSPRHLPGLISKARNINYRFNVTVCPFGIGGENQLLEFYLKNDPQGDSFSNEFSTNMSDVGCKFIVGVFDISEFILNHTNTEDIIHLKLDCETAEYDILNRLIKRPQSFDRIKKLMVEFHNPKNDANNKQWERDRDELISKCEEMGHAVLPWNH